MSDRHSHRVMMPPLAPERPLYPDQPGYTAKAKTEYGWLIELKQSVQRTPTYYGENGEGVCSVGRPIACA